MTCFKRPLLPCLLCYVLGLWWARSLVSVSYTLAVASASAAVLACGFWAWRRQELTPVFLLVFAVAGVVRMQPLVAERQEAHHRVDLLDDGSTRRFRGTVAAVAESLPEGRVRLPLRDVHVTSGTETIALPGRMLVAVTRGGDAERLSLLVPGDEISALGSIEPPVGWRNFRIYNWSESLALERIHALARVRTPARIDRETTAGGKGRLWLAGGLAALRRFASETVQHHMPPHQADMVNSMLFNERRLLTDRDQQIFRDSGTMHLFAVSGLHVSIFSFILLIVLRSVRMSRRAAWSATVLFMLLYVLMLDFIAPAFRAALMAAALTAGHWLRRSVDGTSSLVFSVAVILVVDPLSLWQTGFILSVTGVFAIVCFMPLMGDWSRSEAWRHDDRLRIQAARWLVSGVQLVCAITLVMLPLQFFYFQQFNLLAPLANVFAASLSSLVLAGALATVILGAAFAPLATLAGSATAVVMDTVYWIAEVTASQRWAIVTLPAPAAWSVLVYYAFLLSGYYLVRRDTPEYRPKSAARLVIHSGAAIILLLLVSLMPRFAGTLRIWFLDVGQGDATLIQLPRGQSLLVDAGNARPDAGALVVGPMLRTLGVRPLGDLLATHGDADHVGGMVSLLEMHPVNRLVTAGPALGTDPLSQLIEDAATSAGVARVPVAASSAPIPLGRDTAMQILNPPACAEGADNNGSIALKITHGRFTALLMGDAEAPVETRMVAEGLGACDLLKVGHHGSHHATSAEFVETTKPRVAVISCGRNNRYGHPSPDVVGRLAASGSRIYRTDRHGAVLVESDGDTFSVRTVVTE